MVIRGVGDDLGSGADLPEFMEGNDAPDLRLAELRVEDDGVEYPPKGSFRHGATISAWYANLAAGTARCRSSKRSASWRRRATATAGTSTRLPMPIW